MIADEQRGAASIIFDTKWVECLGIGETAKLDACKSLFLQVLMLAISIQIKLTMRYSRQV
jgi:hypothetical protein